ncbi:MAG: DEAD/DEAH box helicase [Candidatus Competibacteraceae bacterium]|nr:DEAD/DEAH box helicase [Candidatus Competibacteraceae bacterium]
MPFAALGLTDNLARAVVTQGYAAPTPIQSKAIPLVLAGRDVLASAQTGTGKTAAFTLPLLQRLQQANNPTPRSPSRAQPIRALVLTPTRELAAQVADSARVYGRHAPIRSAVMVGGVSLKPQCDALRRGVDLLVATPGRLLDHVNQGNVDLSKVEILVLDEADRMLDMGFIPAIRRILALLPRRRQNLLFSATLPETIRELATDLLHDPVTIDVAPRNATASLVHQQIHPVDQDRKSDLLAHLLHAGDGEQTLVFTRTKHGADRLTRQLERAGLRAAALHGNKSQAARTRALADFKQGQVRVLVATDIAARGLDIAQLPLVVNYELPHVPEDYVHRIGRTGRAGRDGVALSLVSDDETPRLNTIQRLLGRTLPSIVVDGFAPARKIRSASAASAAPTRAAQTPATPTRGSNTTGRPAGKRPDRTPRTLVAPTHRNSNRPRSHQPATHLAKSGGRS